MLKPKNQALEAALNELERVTEKWTRISLAANGIIEAKTSTFRARNGRDVGIQDEHGEKCWIVPFEAMDLLEAAIEADETQDHNPPIRKMTKKTKSPRCDECGKCMEFDEDVWVCRCGNVIQKQRS